MRQVRNHRGIGREVLLRTANRGHGTRLYRGELRLLHGHLSQQVGVQTSDLESRTMVSERQSLAIRDLVRCNSLSAEVSRGLTFIRFSAHASFQLPAVRLDLSLAYPLAQHALIHSQMQFGDPFPTAGLPKTYGRGRHSCQLVAMPEEMTG